MYQIVPLSRDAKVGDVVTWKTVLGNEFKGELTEWDSNVAIVKCVDGLERAVEC